VAAKDGRVTLSGTVKSPAAQQKIGQIAREEPGARGVDDQTTMEPYAEALNAVEQRKPQPIVIPGGNGSCRNHQSSFEFQQQPCGTNLSRHSRTTSECGGTYGLAKGATVSGTVVTAKAQGKIKGEGELALALTSLSTKGQTYPIETNVLSSTVKGKGKRTAATTGGGAAGGALIGGLAGGGKGAGIGALVGATAGFVGGAFTGNKQIEIPAESPLSFTLTAPLTLPPPAK